MRDEQAALYRKSSLASYLAAAWPAAAMAENRAAKWRRKTLCMAAAKS